MAPPKASRPATAQTVSEPREVVQRDSSNSPRATSTKPKSQPARLTAKQAAAARAQAIRDRAAYRAEREHEVKAAKNASAPQEPPPVARASRRPAQTFADGIVQAERSAARWRHK